MRTERNPRCDDCSTKNLLYAEIDTLIADVVVGNFRHRESLLVLRMCSKALRNAIGSSISDWCDKFTKLQHSRINATSDQHYSSVVAAERMSVAAFGNFSGAAKKVMDVSIMQESTFMGALSNRCVLCGQSMTTSCRESTMQDDEQHVIPGYVFGHRSCIRKHIVMLSEGSSAIQRGSEPKELHKELSAVSQMNNRKVTIDKKAVIDRISCWYKTAYLQSSTNGLVFVWLRPHPMVKLEDTLYGSLNITEDDVQQSLMKAAAHANEVAIQADKRRKSVSARIEQHTNQCFVELRLWLGKGHTRWRCIEDLEDFHQNILSSIGFLSTSSTLSAKRVVCAHMSMVYNALILLDKTVRRLQLKHRSAIIDWLVSSLRVDEVFVNKSSDIDLYNMPFLTEVHGYGSATISKDIDSAIDAELAIVNHVLALLAACTSNDLTVTSFQKLTSETTRDGTKYKAEVCIFIRSCQITFSSCVIISHSDICKLKFIVIDHIDKRTADTIPDVPPVPENHDVETVKLFFSSVVNACFSVGAQDVAFSTGISLLVNIDGYREIRDVVQTRSQTLPPQGR